MPLENQRCPKIYDINGGWNKPPIFSQIFGWIHLPTHSGYIYPLENIQNIRWINTPTVGWMKSTARLNLPLLPWESCSWTEPASKALWEVMTHGETQKAAVSPSCCERVKVNQKLSRSQSPVKQSDTSCRPPTTGKESRQSAESSSRAGTRRSRQGKSSVGPARTIVPSPRSRSPLSRTAKDRGMAASPFIFTHPNLSTTQNWSPKCWSNQAPTSSIGGHKFLYQFYIWFVTLRFGFLKLQK